MQEENNEGNKLMSHAPPQVADKQDAKNAVKDIFEKEWRLSEADNSLADAEESVMAGSEYPSNTRRRSRMCSGEPC
eukprot:5062340-Heterocapsa_arctica.AAC.1